MNRKQYINYCAMELPPKLDKIVAEMKEHGENDDIVSMYECMEQFNSVVSEVEKGARRAVLKPEIEKMRMVYGILQEQLEEVRKIKNQFID